MEYRQANLLIKELMLQKRKKGKKRKGKKMCLVHTKGLESHYLKVIRTFPKGHMWTHNGKEIM